VVTIHLEDEPCLISGHTSFARSTVRGRRIATPPVTRRAATMPFTCTVSPTSGSDKVRSCPRRRINSKLPGLRVCRMIAVEA